MAHSEETRNALKDKVEKLGKQLKEMDLLKHHLKNSEFWGKRRNLNAEYQKVKGSLQTQMKNQWIPRKNKEAILY